MWSVRGDCDGVSLTYRCSSTTSDDGEVGSDVKIRTAKVANAFGPSEEAHLY